MNQFFQVFEILKVLEIIYIFSIINIYMKHTLRKNINKKLRKSIRNGGSKIKSSKTMTVAKAKSTGKILFPHGPLSEHGKLRYASSNSGTGGHLNSVSLKPVTLVKNGSVSVYGKSHSSAGEPKMELRPVLEHEPIENFDDVHQGQKLLVESFDLSTPVLSVRGRPDARHSAILTVQNVEQPESLHGKAIVTFEEIDPASRTNVKLYISPWKRTLTHYSNFYAFKAEKSQQLDQMKLWADK